MALDTLADIEAAMNDWLQNTNITVRIPDMIALAESRIRYGAQGGQFASDPVRCYDMETSADLAIVGGTETTAQPTGFLGIKTLYIDGTPRQPVEVKSSGWIRRSKWGDGVNTGTPRFVAIEGTNLLWGPLPDQAYTGKLVYYKAFDGLYTTATNALLSRAPGVYLYSALLEAAIFVGALDKAAQYLAQYQSIVAGLNAASDEMAARGSPPVMSASVSA